ncbi:hypothetical protein FT663_03989 [Candidozyma haemuli var. vulneris]|uniref:Uncharacterized protein n=1 Tax=Candidozyma haemuli TaxID=45357 RepID=A0A2V1AUX5_9ASCO|nr:hypothetical protein CXQ85_000564 [[Candida] haemuloni]KAF3985032.1 hypothetical protein FT662_05396 [[Candida] haemuloni var. vulneris]KAF3988520.1 hypothetical protein FT663_03989 [[Candida] haemuloni var. vulneris]PVH21582.1 hypothetical protein CXQ85_000564 [[Candida] haemuloni]
MDFDCRARCSIPPLDEIVAPFSTTANCGPYSRANFVAYLASSHCTENLEFIVELDRFIVALADLSRANLTAAGDAEKKIAQQDSLTHQWSVLYKVFIAKDSIKEVNIPWTLRSTFLESNLPPLSDLRHTRSVVYELLLDSYNEFILYTRESTNDSTTLRRRSEIVPPDQPSPSWSQTSCYSSVTHDVAPCPPYCHSTPAADREKSSAACLKDQWEKALLDFELGKSDNHETTHTEQPSSDSNSNYGSSRSRNGSDGTMSSVRTSSRGSSIGSMVDGIKGYSNLKKAVKKFKHRRSSAEGVDLQ